MSFNKHFPHRPEPAKAGLDATERAWLFRMATWVSALMLITGYILMWVFWD